MVLNNVNSIELDISNHPYIIEIGGTSRVFCGGYEKR